MSRLDNLTPEEQLEAVEKYRKAQSVKQPTDVEALTDINGRDPSPETIKKFERALSQVFGPKVTWHFVPMWAPASLYLTIQDNDDPYVRYLTTYNIKRHIRRWIWNSKEPWFERSYTTAGRIKMHFPYGHIAQVNGWVRKGTIYVDSEKTFPPRFGYRTITEKRHINKLPQVHQEWVKEEFEKAGFKW